MRMHIAILDEELPFPLNSGKRIRTFNLLKRLADRHRITYLCHRNADPEEATLAEKEFRRVGIKPILVDRSVPSKSGLRFYARLVGNLFSSLPYSVATHTSLELRLQAEKLAQTDAPDLWHCEWTPYAQTLRQPLGRWVVMAHNVESLIWQRYIENESNPPKRWYIHQQYKKFESFERWAYNAATRTIAVSCEDAKLIEQRFGVNHVEVVDNGVDTDFFKPNVATYRNPNHVLFLGSLDWRPNLDAVRLLLDTIFPEVRKQEPNAKLLVVGRNPPDWLRQRVTQEAHVELHGNVADVRPYLWSSGMLIVPLRIGGGSRLKILEALSSGLPVVTSQVGVEGLDLSGDHHLLVVGEAEVMSHTIVYAIRNPHQMDRLTQPGRERVLHQYDWSRLADRLEQVWSTTLEQPIQIPGRQASLLKSLVSR
jgi:polysaccharide biosynthesis protein PslH